MATLSSSLIATAAQLERVQMTFDGFASLALTDVNLEVGRGEVLGLIGPEGSGKSTLLMLLAGRLRPADGKVRVFGRSPRRSSIRALIGYLPPRSRQPHRGTLFGWLGRSLRRLKPDAERASSTVPNNLRVEQLLLKKPEIMVLDEPFLGLEAAAALEMKGRIEALARQGKTVILSDRWLAPAKDVCGRMAILFRGQIQAAGSLAQLLALPDAIRIMGPVLPPASAERVLITMRAEMLGQASLPARSAAGAGVAMEYAKPPEGGPTFATRENPIFAALTQPRLPTAQDGPPAESADPVNHEKLAQLTKLHSEAADGSE